MVGINCRTPGVHSIAEQDCYAPEKLFKTREMTKNDSFSFSRFESEEDTRKKKKKKKVTVCTLTQALLKKTKGHDYKQNG